MLMYNRRSIECIVFLFKRGGIDYFFDYIRVLTDEQFVSCSQMDVLVTVFCWFQYNLSSKT